MLLLLTRPRYDRPTHYLYHWAELLIDEAKQRKVEYIDLEKENVNKKKFQSYLAKQPINVVIINGHGDANSVGGHDNVEILSTKDTGNLLKDKNVFIRACDAGSILGPHLMKSGAKGFIGYAQPFIFAINPESFQTPTKDEYAGPVLECSNQVAISLIKGKDVTGAQQDSFSKYQDKIDEYSSSKTTSSFILPFLFWNMNCQVCYS